MLRKYLVFIILVATSVMSVQLFNENENLRLWDSFIIGLFHIYHSINYQKKTDSFVVQVVCSPRG